MRSSEQLLVASFVMAVLLIFTSGLGTASTILTEEPGNTVLGDGVGDLQLRNCSLTFPDHPCSLAPTVPLSSPPFTDVAGAGITAVGEGVVTMVITLQASVPPAPTPPFLAYFFQFENGGIGGQPGPTDTDDARVVWNGTEFTANWMVITDCNPRTVEEGPAIPFSFSSERKTVTVQVDICDLAARAGNPLEWWAGVRRLPFVHPTFTDTVPVDVVPNIFAFNP